jgi:opacity protein-like surface antigen
MKKSFTLLFALFAVLSMQAQDAFVVSGGNATGSGGSSSFSVGQALYTTNTGTTGSAAQGIQQAFEIFVLSNPELTALTLSAVIYPNPASDKITLVLRNSNRIDLSYILYDGNGKALSSALVQELETPIRIQDLLAGVYILTVNQNNSELKTFKIIKK